VNHGLYAEPCLKKKKKITTESSTSRGTNLTAGKNSVPKEVLYHNAEGKKGVRDLKKGIRLQRKGGGSLQRRRRLGDNPPREITNPFHHQNEISLAYQFLRTSTGRRQGKYRKSSKKRSVLSCKKPPLRLTIDSQNTNTLEKTSRIDEKKRVIKGGREKGGERLVPAEGL